MTKEKLKKIFLLIFLATVIMLTGFRLLAGEQFEYRDSRYNIGMEAADSATEELHKGVVVEQEFINKIDRFSSMTFAYTTHYRKNHGTLRIKLYCDDSLLIYEKIDVSSLNEGEVIYIEADKMIEDLVGRKFRVSLEADSQPGSGISLLMNSKGKQGNMYISNMRRFGNLCFSAQGQEYIFTGQYYWYMALGVWAAVALALYLSYRDFCNGKPNYIVIAIMAIGRYKFLISQLVARDFKSKYKRSVLGIFWSFLNPLLTMTVQYFVFSTFFNSDTKNYLVYLLAGVVCYNFFNEATTMCLTSVSGNARLITKVYIPKYIFPLSRTISSMINLGISLIPLLLVSLFTGVVLQKSAILVFYFLACLVVFALGVGMLLATLMVFFRDIQFLWSVLSMIWMYATPIFYPASIIPEKYSFIMDLNPLQHFIKNVRMCLIDGISPGPKSYIFCFIFAVGSLLLGLFVFKKEQDKFTLYL